jgi:UDP-GlcNAc3NAcA epimerase
MIFGAPCRALGEAAEWLEAGWNMLVGCDPERILQAALEARPGAESAQPYGDSRVRERGVKLLVAARRGGVYGLFR